MKETREFKSDLDRYYFDFNACRSEKGWAQIDTGQDAHYFGSWTNPFERKIVSYTEGDICVQECESDEEFVEELTKMVVWNKEHGYWRGIDDMCRDDIREEFERLGVGEFLHPLPAPASAEGQAAQSPSPD